MNNLQLSLISFSQTFVSAFLLALGASLSSGVAIQWTSAFWVSLVLAAVRVAVKKMWESTLPVSIGGKAR